MEKIVDDSITKMHPLSPNDNEHESNDKIDDLTPKVGIVVATTEGIEQPNSFMHVAASDDLIQPTIEMSNVENHNEGLDGIGVISHKRKLSEDEGEVAIEKVSYDRSLPNDSAAQQNEVMASNAQKNEVGPSVAQKKDVDHDDAKRIKLDMNVPIIDEDEGGEEVDKVGSVDSPLAALGLQLAPQGAEVDKKVRENEDWAPYTLGLGLQLAPEGLKVNEEITGNEDSSYEFRGEESEAGSSSLNKNDVESSPAQIYDFDLNVPLTDEDEDEA